MNFIKENFNLIVKLFGFQLAMSVFGIFVQTATVMNDALFLFASIFSVGFHMVLLYITMWDVGGKDKLKTDGGRMHPMPLKGAWLALLANLPKLLLALVSMIGYYNYNPVLNDPAWAFNLYSIPSYVIQFANATCRGILYSLFAADELIHPLVLMAIAVPPILACALGYFLGSKNFSFAALFGFKKKEEKR